MTATGQETSTPYEPVSVEAKYPPPRGHIGPDKSKSWIRRLSPIVLAHKWTMAFGLGCAFLVALVTVAIPKVIQLAVDESILTNERPLSQFAWALAFLGIARFTLSFVFRYQVEKTAELIQFELRTLIYDHFNRLSFSFFDRVQTGELISRANSDIRAVERFLSFAPMRSMTLVQFAGALIFMIPMSLSLTLVALAPMPLLFFINRHLRSKLYPISWMVQARAAGVATIVEENVTGVRVVKSFAAESHQINLLERAAAKLKWVATRQIDLRARFTPIMENLPRTGFVLVLLYGGYLAIEGKVTIGVILAFSSYIIMLQVPFRVLGFLILMAQRAAASAGRILEILDEEPEIVDSPSAVDLINPRGEVEFRNVHFSYGESGPTLKGFNLHLKPGETVAMVGRTGCGKSTAARLIPRFYDVTHGQVLVDGIDVRALTLSSLRAHIGMVLEEPFLFSESIRDNIGFGQPDSTMEEIVSAAKAAGADDFFMELPQGYDTVVGERGYTLSGGQRQRAAIARTLVTNPPILVLDDATSSVDVGTERQIHDALRQLMKGRTTLIIAHRLSTISLADRVILVDDGKVVAEGTHQELLRRVPLYSEVLARTEEEWSLSPALDSSSGQFEPLSGRVL